MESASHVSEDLVLLRSNKKCKPCVGALGFIGSD